MESIIKRLLQNEYFAQPLYNEKFRSLFRSYSRRKFIKMNQITVYYIETASLYYITLS